MTIAAAANILVIKLSALGDMVLACAAFERIRSAHPKARITLLTTPAYAELAAISPYFNAVDCGGRPRTLPGAMDLILRLRRAPPDLVYDLQGNDRTNALFQALRPHVPLWSGVAWGCALPHRDPDRMRRHTLERQAGQLRDAGIWPDAPTAAGAAPPPDIAWLVAAAQPVPPSPKPRALLVPGSAPTRPGKRWPAERYAELAGHLERLGFETTLIGGPAEAELGEAIARRAPGARNLIGRTSFADIAALGATAAVAVGNDTGPIHLIAAAGAPTLVLFSAESDPALCAPRGRVRMLREARLDDVPAGRVLSEAMALIGPRA